MINQYTSAKRLYWKRVSDRESKRAKRGWVKRHQDIAARPVDADTLRWRAMQDRKGKFIEVILGHTICHSKRRHDSYDVIKNSKVVCSGGRVVVGRYLGRLLP